MDPPASMNRGLFQSVKAASSSYNMAEIWPFPINGGGGVGGSGGGLDLSRVQFGQSLSQFTDNANRDVSGDDPMLVDRRDSLGGGARKRREAALENGSAKVVSTSTGNAMNDCDAKRPKPSDDNHEPVAELEENSNKPKEENSNPAEPPKQDYIHVRARRGQATDSHSLAERARREKISQRMKLLQDLVPGCNKVIGKALVLDEIINYIQSLQRQVEFLSMKLEAVNSRMDPNIEEFPSKDFGQQTFDTAGVAFGSETTRDYSRGSSPEWLHMQIGGSFQRST